MQHDAAIGCSLDAGDRGVFHLWDMDHVHVDMAYPIRRVVGRFQRDVEMQAGPVWTILFVQATRDHDLVAVRSPMGQNASQKLEFVWTFW